VVDDASSGADGIGVEDWGQGIINESSAKCHGLSDALVLGSLDEGDEARASPGDDVGFRARGSDLLHVRSEIGCGGGSENIISNECATLQGAGVAESFSRAVPEGVVSSNLDEGGVLGC